MPSELTNSRDSHIALETKVEYLMRPDVYPEIPTGVDTLETHMSWVFLTDHYVYKLKKPVRYPFLDFSTVEARRRDCEEEVRLNRRLAASVYLGLVPLAVSADGDLCLGATGRTVDWLVKMRRLPAHRMLDNALRRDAARDADIEKLACALARFYRAARPVELKPAEYTRRFEEDIRANRQALTTPAYRLPQDVTERVSRAQLDLLRDDPGLLHRRVREGKIVEGHGDLRPEHICLEPEPVIIDCLEFKRDFRILDAADELAFLAVECELLGAPWVGGAIFETYRRVTDDRPPERLVDFYKCYRACLRAKIALWHLDEPDVRAPETWTKRAMAYLRLAHEYAGRLQR